MTPFAIGAFFDIRDLEKIKPELIILYFEPELARTSTYEADLGTYHGVASHMRPFIEVREFLDFQREMSAMFDDSLKEVPLMIEIVGIERQKNQVVVKGLLPFLDELDLEGEDPNIIKM
jgi:hypothetical protein